MNELKNLQCVGLTTLGAALKHALDVLNINRMQTGIDTYGQGRCPFYLEPSVIVVITDGGKYTTNSGVHQDVSFTKCIRFWKNMEDFSTKNSDLSMNISRLYRIYNIFFTVHSTDALSYSWIRINERAIQVGPKTVFIGVKIVGNSSCGKRHGLSSQ